MDECIGYKNPFFKNIECRIEQTFPNIYILYLTKDKEDVAEIVIKEKPKDLLICNLIVYDGFRKNGYSMILMYIIAKRFINKGYTHINLVDTSNDGRLYEKLMCKSDGSNLKLKCNLNTILEETSKYLQNNWPQK